MQVVACQHSAAQSIRDDMSGIRQGGSRDLFDSLLSVAMSRRKSSLVRYWGYLLFGGAVVLFFARDVGPVAVSGAFAFCTLWMLLAAPTWCGAKNRGEGYCRNNTSGLLGGCQIRQHKWQRFKALARLDRFQNAFRGWFTGAQQQVATCALVASTVGVVAGLFK